MPCHTWRYSTADVHHKLNTLRGHPSNKRRHTVVEINASQYMVYSMQQTGGKRHLLEARRSNPNEMLPAWYVGTHDKTK